MRYDPQAEVAVKTPDNQWHVLSTLADVYWLGDDGFGMAPSERITEKGPMQHGVTDLGFRLQPRIITLVFAIQKPRGNDYWDGRDEVLRWFKPSNDALILRLRKFDYRRALDIYYYNDLTLPSNDGRDLRKNEVYHRIAVQCYAPDPTWYDPETVSLNYDLGLGAEMFEVPLEVPVDVGADSAHDLPIVINYAGSWLTYPIIRIYGPIDDPVLENSTTGEKLDFSTGITIGVGEWYEIDCRYGYKTVVDQAGVNKIADLTTDSDLATFHIEAEYEAAGGVNTLLFSGANGSPNTRVTIQYMTRYIGI